MLNATKLHRELTEAGIPIYGVSSDGRIDFKGAATDAQRTLAKDILAKHDSYDYREERRKAYGSVEEQLDMIYWDKVDGTSLWLQYITEVKLRYPK